MGGPTQKTIKRLFAVSMNQCAFPGCDIPLVEASGTITGEICHIKAASPGGPRYDSNQIEKERHDFVNLVLMCSRHHHIIDEEKEVYTVEAINEIKKSHESSGLVEINPGYEEIAKGLLKNYQSNIVINRNGNVAINSPGAIQARTVKVNTKKTKVNMLPPSGSIGSDIYQKAYAKYLIDRYNEFQTAHTEKKGRYKYIAIYEAIKRGFGCNWDSVPQDRFEDLVLFLQRRIDNTKLGRNKKSQGRGRYHSFEQHLSKMQKRK